MRNPDPSLFAPIPGTQAAPRGLFVDRWGTLLVRPEKGFVKTFQELEFVEGAVDALFRASRAGWNVYLLGNEPAVARGKLGDDAWTELETAMLAHLAEHGCRIERNYACLDHPTEGVGDHQQDSVYLLPNTGAFYHAAHEDGIELGRSWVIGDSTLELVAGWRAGLRLAGVETGFAVEDAAFEVSPEFMAKSVTEAVIGLLSLEGALHP